MPATPEFPIVDAVLLTPEDSENGNVGVCTNTVAPGQVYNEVDLSLRPNTSVYGPLVVSRDGAERMILNSLVHPSLDTIILFANESSSFKPSTNLLQATRLGVEPSSGNRVMNGIGIGAQYPNLNRSILDSFRENIRVLPIFSSETKSSRDAIEAYLDWLKPNIGTDLYDLLADINSGNTIYYDGLNKLLAHVAAEPTRKKSVAQLNPKDFQHLQPPRVEVPPSPKKPIVNFRVSDSNGLVRVDIVFDGNNCFLEEGDDFLLGYSLMKQLGENTKNLSSLEQLLIGVEVGRVSTEINNQLNSDSFVESPVITEGKRLNSESHASLVTDSKYYYIISQVGGEVSVKCMAHDVCEEVFELRSSDCLGLIKKLAELDRFDDYEMDFLHRFDVGVQVARAYIATQNQQQFVQDFGSVFRINTESMPLVLAEGDTFLGVHKKLLQAAYTRGLTAEHGDQRKGTARTIAALAIFRGGDEPFRTMPSIYRQGSKTPAEVRSEYAVQLLREDHDGSYSYGERTRAFFGSDQLVTTAAALSSNPSRAAIIQRFDPTVDMEISVDSVTGETKSSHDPCLTHDIYFMQNAKLNVLHISRAHNLVNAYPENAFGLHDAYDNRIAADLGVKLGDTYIFSSRANILMLTEEQRAKAILSEPAKPFIPSQEQDSGPFKLGKHINQPGFKEGLFYLTRPLRTNTSLPSNETLSRLTNLEGVDTVDRAINYLLTKGSTHNNPILSDFRAGRDDPQGSYLAFFQANVVGSKLYASSVFMNRNTSSYDDDIELSNYLATKFAKALGVGFGDLSFFTIRTTNG